MSDAIHEHLNYVGGEWAAGNGFTPNINPSDLADTVGLYAKGTAAQVDQAVRAAHAAMPAWQGFGVQARADALEKIGTEILARKDELGALLAREEGKTMPEAAGEVARAGNIFKFFAGECLRTAGELLPSVRPNIGVEITREPVGVVGIISPWNFPIAIPSWKVAPALAYGNCVVIKPADIVPGSAWALAEIISRAGLPPGAFNLVMGSGRDVGQARDDALAKGITINGLVILSDSPLPWNPEHTNPPGGLGEYYRKNVIGGPGAFVMVAENHDSFGQAIVKKMIAEIAWAEPLRPLILR